MNREAIILGLKKAAVVMHSLALSFKNLETTNETLELVIAISKAVKMLEDKDHD